MVAKIPLLIADYSKIHFIAKDIESMLKSKSKVILEVPPYCFLSRIEEPNAKLVFGCNLEYMTEEELVSVEQDIIHESGEIIRLHNATNPKHMTIRFFKKNQYRADIQN
ncbi:hypothetical protein Vadar_031708 [Vaccinium darrowii]|uniref:Uncharacterized protein n=1 Tax=Vaccinium darrowii TaxID=229202 RepID=A0ACB7Y3M5_9ERIC|nr:hypothetical protein Vadar_031708 [Vaccinium darrowii]